MTAETFTGLLQQVLTTAGVTVPVWYGQPRTGAPLPYIVVTESTASVIKSDARGLLVVDETHQFDLWQDTEAEDYRLPDRITTALLTARRGRVAGTPVHRLKPVNTGLRVPVDSEAPADEPALSRHMWTVAVWRRLPA